MAQADELDVFPQESSTFLALVIRQPALQGKVEATSLILLALVFAHSARLLLDAVSKSPNQAPIPALISLFLLQNRRA
jgi:hypothetical protein